MTLQVPLARTFVRPCEAPTLHESLVVDKCEGPGRRSKGRQTVGREVVRKGGIGV